MKKAGFFNMAHICAHPRVVRNFLPKNQLTFDNRPIEDCLTIDEDIGMIKSSFKAR